MSDLWRYVVALLVWPGLLSGALLGWFFLWVVRKVTARFQRRTGPPFFQPFYDFVKLLGKRTLIPGGVNKTLFYGLPLVSVAALICALMLLPAPGNPVSSFPADLVLMIYLLEVPALCEVLAGFVSRSPYGQVSATREAMMMIAYNLPFLAAVIALAMSAGSFRLYDLAALPFGWVHVAAVLAFMFALQARLKLNPFSIANAEQEILDGAHTEFNGAPLALFELTHALEVVALCGLLAVIVLPPLVSVWAEAGVYLLIMLVAVILVTAVAAGTARLKVNQATRFYFVWGALLALLAFAATLL